MLSMLLATSMVAGTTVAATGCKFGSNSNEPITLTVYSQVAKLIRITERMGSRSYQG